jgi:hypothetical protein
MLGVSYNTALLIKYKIQQIMKERDESKPLDAAYIQVDNPYWGGKKRDGKRGRGATGKIPFVAAVSIGKKGHPLAIRFSQVSAFSTEAIKAWPQQKHMAPKRNVVTDGLDCFIAFQESGHEHIPIITGGGPQGVEMIEFKWVNTIGNVKNALHGTFHAISKKHFPRLAEFCYRFNKGEAP